MSELDETDQKLLRIAYVEALTSYDEGGCPIGAVLARDGEVIGRGRNRRVQDDDPIAQGEMDAIRKAGRQTSYADTTLYTTLSPGMLGAGAIVHFGIVRVVVGENANQGGNEDFLRAHGIEVIVADDPQCRDLMARFIQQKPELWAEDSGEDPEEDQ